LSESRRLIVELKYYDARILFIFIRMTERRSFFEKIY